MTTKRLNDIPHAASARDSTSNEIKQLESPSINNDFPAPSTTTWCKRIPGSSNEIVVDTESREYHLKKDTGSYRESVSNDAPNFFNCPNCPNKPQTHEIGIQVDLLPSPAVHEGFMIDAFAESGSVHSASDTKSLDYSSILNVPHPSNTHSSLVSQRQLSSRTWYNTSDVLGVDRSQFGSINDEPTGTYESGSDQGFPQAQNFQRYPRARDNRRQSHKMYHLVSIYLLLPVLVMTIAMHYLSTLCTKYSIDYCTSTFPVVFLIITTMSLIVSACYEHASKKRAEQLSIRRQLFF